MAGRPQNRLELRRQYDAAEPMDPMEDEADDAVDEGDDEDGESKKKKKPKAPAKSKAKTPKAAKPAARMKIVWKVVNDAFKELGTFEYNQKEAAEARAAELTAKGKGTHFVQKAKEPMADNAPGLGAAIPRPAPAAIVAEIPKAAKGQPEPDVDEEIDDDDEDSEPEPDADDDEE